MSLHLQQGNTHPLQMQGDSEVPLQEGISNCSSMDPASKVQFQAMGLLASLLHLSLHVPQLILLASALSNLGGSMYLNATSIPPSDHPVGKVEL